jgi:hypothetical protein
LNTSGTSPAFLRQPTKETYVRPPARPPNAGIPESFLWLYLTRLFTVLYLTMRFAKTIKQIQGLQAYHAGDKLIVEVDIVLDASTPLKDSHDLR